MGSHGILYLLEAPFDGDELGDEFLYRLDALLTFAGGPLYAALHEACYAQHAATRWSAHRIRDQFPAFSAKAALDGAEPVLFTGEMIYPWLFQADPVLRPLAEAAEILAEHDAWPALYDPARLAANEVPVAAAVYYDDMYVPQQFSLQTAARIRGLRRWVTSEYEHDGLRLGRGAVLDRLIGLVRGTGRRRGSRGRGGVRPGRGRVRAHPHGPPQLRLPRQARLGPDRRGLRGDRLRGRGRRVRRAGPALVRRQLAAAGGHVGRRQVLAAARARGPAGPRRHHVRRRLRHRRGHRSRPARACPRGAPGLSGARRGRPGQYP